MKKLLILTRFPAEYEPRKFAEAARKKGIAAEIVNYQDIGKIGEIDYLVPRSSAHRSKKSLVGLKTRILRQLPEGIVCLNKKTFLKWPLLGKIKQTQVFSQRGLPTIPFLEKPKFPLILKAEFGSHSRRVIRVESQEEARKVMESYSGRWLYQPLIKSPVYWRVIVLGRKSLGAMERKTSKRFLREKRGVSTYVHPGGVNIEDLAIKAAQVFRAEFAGVDLLVDKEKLMIIEVNRSPQFRIFEKRTRVDVAGAVIGYLARQ